MKPKKNHTKLKGTSPGSEYTPEEAAFIKAVERYRTEHHRPFLTCVEILEVAKSLGYRKVKPKGDK